MSLAWLMIVEVIPEWDLEGSNCCQIEWVISEIAYLITSLWDWAREMNFRLWELTEKKKPAMFPLKATVCVFKHLQKGTHSIMQHVSGLSFESWTVRLCSWKLVERDQFRKAVYFSDPTGQNWRSTWRTTEKE